MGNLKITSTIHNASFKTSNKRLGGKAQKDKTKHLIINVPFLCDLCSRMPTRQQRTNNVSHMANDFRRMPFLSRKLTMTMSSTWIKVTLVADPGWMNRRKKLLVTHKNTHCLQQFKLETNGRLISHLPALLLKWAFLLTKYFFPIVIATKRSS